MRRNEFRPRQRGFTLIELAIALTVVGLVLGASIIPLRMLDEARQLQDEQRRLETVRDAVVGYALRHQTRARIVQFVSPRGHPGGLSFPDPENLRGDWEFHLSAGRPYLPCPDADGDGFEDRKDFVQGVDMRPGSTEVKIAHHPLDPEALFFGQNTGDPFSIEISPGISPHGECVVSKGTVPWRTLGVDPSDGWGNRHTYFADRVFSNAIFGFDRQTIADWRDPRIPDASGYRSLRLGEGLFTPFSTNVCPAAICDGGRTVAPGEQEPGAPREEWEPGCPKPLNTISCRFPTDGVILKAGAVARTTIGASLEGEQFRPGHVTDGLPFVLVSHGPNGRFAVNHWATLEDPVDYEVSRVPYNRNICNLTGERLILGRGDTIRLEDRALAHEAMNGTRSRQYPSIGCSVGFRLPNGPGGGPFHLSFFAWEPPGVSRRGEFDDLLLWMTREELSLAAPGRIPPLPPMVIGYFP